MNRLDEIIQKNMPVVMVPAYDKIEPLKVGKTRLLMAKTGLYLETVQPWGELIQQLWQSPRPLPYGPVEEKDTFAELVFGAAAIIKNTIVPLAAEYARNEKEWAGFIAWHPDYLEYVPVEFTSSAIRVNYKMPEILQDKHIAIDIHSHGTIKPFFSKTDNADDKGGVKIAIVLGDYRHSETDKFDAEIRYCVEGFHFYPNGRRHEA